jgi:hypothetical protein
MALFPDRKSQWDEYSKNLIKSPKPTNIKPNTPASVNWSEFMQELRQIPEKPSFIKTNEESREDFLFRIGITTPEQLAELHRRMFGHIFTTDKPTPKKTPEPTIRPTFTYQPRPEMPSNFPKSGDPDYEAHVRRVMGMYNPSRIAALNELQELRIIVPRKRPTQ